MGLQWATRAKAMDDPNKSRVVGKIDWMAPPQGHGRISGDGYAISAFSKQDPDAAVPHHRHLGERGQHARGGRAAWCRRGSRCCDDPELGQANSASIRPRWPRSRRRYPFPALPEFYAVGEFITRRVLQAVNGEMPVKEALDAAASETEHFLKGRGYYG